MGFMDKVRSQATQLAEKAQEGLQTGKGKLDELQEKKRAGALLQELGAVTYRQQTGRDSAGTAGEVTRLVGELQQIEQSGVDFLATSGNGSALDDNVVQGNASPAADPAAASGSPEGANLPGAPGDPGPAAY